MRGYGWRSILLERRLLRGRRRGERIENIARFLKQGKKRLKGLLFHCIFCLVQRDGRAVAFYAGERGSLRLWLGRRLRFMFRKEGFDFFQRPQMGRLLCARIRHGFSLH